MPRVHQHRQQAFRGRALCRARGHRARSGANRSSYDWAPTRARLASHPRRTGRCSGPSTDIRWYNDPEGYELRTALAEQHGVDLDALCLGSGIDDLLGLVVRMVVEPGTPVVTSLGAYPTFNYHVKGFGGVLHEVPYRDDRIDLDALLDGVRQYPARRWCTWRTRTTPWAPGMRDGCCSRSFVAELPETTACWSWTRPTWSSRPDNIDLPIATERRARDPDAHLLQGTWDGRGANRLRRRTRGYQSRRSTRFGTTFGINRVAQAGALASLWRHAVSCATCS